MDLANRLLVRPVTWSSMTPIASTSKQNPISFPCIQIFGYTSDGQSIYVQIPRNTTWILKFGQTVDDEMVTNITEILNPISITSTNNIVIVRAPELSPIQLTANPDYEGIATWEDIKQDPYGEVESLWEARDISPYDWIVINRYAPIPGKYTNCQLNIRTEEKNIFSADNIDVPNVFPRLFFWDIQVFADKKGEYPNSTNPDDAIALLSVITVSKEGTNGYTIINGTVNEQRNNMVTMKAADEKDLLNKFFALYNTFQPDRQIYYNGDMFDMPYLLNRLSLYNLEIPRISKITSLYPEIQTKSYPTPFGREINRTVVIPGNEVIDLIHYYRLFYPHFTNHKLNTISKAFLGQFSGSDPGNEILDTGEMMEVIRIRNESFINKIVEYSLMDSLRMRKLWDVNNISANLEYVCNNLGISIDSLLRLSCESIIDRAVYNIDAGTSLTKASYINPIYPKEATRGIYCNIYIYDYSELYRGLMRSSDQTLATILASRLKRAPPKLILTAFYSSYIDRADLLPQLNNMLENILATNLVIALEPFIIRSIGPLRFDWLKEIERIPCYAAVSKASYITLDNSGNLELAGLSKLCRPKFDLAYDVIKQYLMLIYADNLDNFIIPNMEELPIEKFALTERIGNIENLSLNGTKYKLAVQYGATIATWVTVKYIMTNRGPILMTLLGPNDKIDYGYYTNELNTYMTELQTLKVYGL